MYSITYRILGKHGSFHCRVCGTNMTEAASRFAHLFQNCVIMQMKEEEEELA